jgi:hypothetical protein
MRNNVAFARLLVPAFLLAGALAGPALAQDKKAEKKAAERGQKVLIDNDKVRVTESIWKPGESNPMVERGYRVTRVISGSTTMERTYADGKKDKREFKAGDTFASDPDKVSMKNIGKGEVVTYTVTPKTKK